jgi:hypothetical protein
MQTDWKSLVEVCAPLASVLANSENVSKTTQRHPSVCEMYLSTFLYEDLVASERVEAAQARVFVRGVGGAGGPFTFWQNQQEFWLEYFQASNAILRSYSTIR